MLERGCAVQALDNLSTGALKNIEHLKPDANFTFTEGDVTEAAGVEELIDGVDGVFHLAAVVGVKLVFKNPINTILTNIRGAEVVFGLAAKAKKKVVLASSSEVYGKGVRIPLSEEDDLLLGPTTCPRWAYACSKAIDEFLALAYWKEQRAPSTICRFFNTVGPGQTGEYGMVIPRFIRQALRGEPLTVYGDGKQTRCFAFVGDVTRALIELMERSDTNGEVYNVGSDEEISIAELAEKVIEKTGGKSKIQFVEFEEAFGPDFEDMRRRAPNLAKLRSTIEWNHLTDIDTILSKTIESIRAEIS